MPHPFALFEITEEQIDVVVTRFYALVRADKDLGPVFAAHVATNDWPAHQAKIAGFWRNAILRENTYAGNPMQAHLMAGNVRPEHFAIWLALFDTVLERELPTETARAFSALAHRIGRGLRIGLEHVKQPENAPPNLI